jgi:hypothetical protein
MPGEDLKSSYQTVGIAIDWFFETDDPIQRFGPDHPITKDVRSDDAIREFREEWAKEGYRLPFSWSHSREKREGPLILRALDGAAKYGMENIKMCFALHPLAGISSRITAVGGVIGSFDEISVEDAGDGQVKFQVFNETGLLSFSRIPGTDRSIIRNRARSERGPGGTLVQYFFWFEPMH